LWLVVPDRQQEATGLPLARQQVESDSNQAAAFVQLHSTSCPDWHVLLLLLLFVFWLDYMKLCRSSAGTWLHVRLFYVSAVWLIRVLLLLLLLLQARLHQAVERAAQVPGQRAAARQRRSGG
jgi:protein-S-isoprenylcysteine O-methyltransferase Ste14